MGAKTWMLVYADTKVEEALRGNPQLDREATWHLATALFPSEKLEPIGQGDLGYTNPPDDELHIGCFPGVSIVAATEFALEHPSQLPEHFIEHFISSGRSPTIYLHAMHSVVAWFAFAQWTDGRLVRSLSLDPERIMEDIGEPLPFERPFWSGQNRASDDDEDGGPIPFNPLELGEAALKEFFGYQLEGVIDPALLQPASIPLLKYKRNRFPGFVALAKRHTPVRPGINCRMIPAETWVNAREALISYFSRRYNRPDAEDLAHETLLALWKSEYYQFEKEEDFLKICYGFARRIEAEGKRARQPTALFKDVGELDRADLRKKEWELIQEAARHADEKQVRERLTPIQQFKAVLYRMFEKVARRRR